MKVRKFAALCLLAAATTVHAQMQIPPAPNRVPELPRPDGFREANRASFTKSLPVARATALWQAAIESPGIRLVDVVSIDPAQLRILQVGPNGEIAAFAPLPAPPGPRQFSFAGQRLDLAWVAENTREPDPQRHVTFQIMGASQGYARISESLGQFVGTIVTAEATYRILTVAPEVQGIYRLTAADDQIAAKYLRVAGSQNPSMVRAERLHLFMERIADIQPWMAFASETGRSLVLRGGELGTLPDGAVSNDGIMRILRRFSDINFMPEELAIDVERVYLHPKTNVVEFRQYIDGIPVFGMNRLDLDPDRKILEITTKFFDPAETNGMRLMTEAEALVFAQREIGNEIGEPVVKTQQYEATELYFDVGGPGPMRLAPKYYFKLRAGERQKVFGVVVNGYSGATLIVRPVP